MNTAVLNESDSRKVLYLIFMCIASAIGGLLFGIDTLVIGGTISSVTEQFQLSNSQSGWFVSSALAGCLVGSLISGKISDAWGRKKPLIFSAILALLSVIGCVIAESYFILAWSRFIGGIGIGIAAMVSPLYISEISPARHRGKLTSLFQLAITIGILVAIGFNALIVSLSEGKTSDGSFFDYIFIAENWRGMFGVEFIPCVLFLLICFFFPESPRWLVKNNKEEAAFNILSRFIDKDEATKSIQDCKEILAAESAGSYRELFTQKTKRKALFIALFIAIISEFSGVTTVFYYGSTFLEDAMGKGAALGGFTIIGIINVVFTVVSIFLIDSIGRRKLLLIGTIGCVASLFLVGLFIDSKSTPGYVIILLFALFVTFFATSLGSIKFIVGAEIFPISVRGRAMAISTAAVWLPGTIINSFVPSFVENFGLGNLFFMFAVILSSQIIFIIYKMPETANKSLEQIEFELLRS